MNSPMKRSGESEEEFRLRVVEFLGEEYPGQYDKERERVREVRDNVDLSRETHLRYSGRKER